MAHASSDPLQTLIRDLSRPEAHTGAGGDVRVIQTHASVVFLTAEHALKIKKPVDFGFLDYSTLSLRRKWCHEEVRVNRRLAPSVYLGVEPITMRDGRRVVGGAHDEAVEWAVLMRRLDDGDTLRHRIEAQTLQPATLDRVAARLSRFHAEARRGDDVDEYGSWDTVAFNARENLEQTSDHIGHTVSAALHDRVACATERELARLRPIIDERARAHRPCDCHGDLRLEHVYVGAGDQIEIIDAIEFNERFRYGDPVSDIAFLAMELSLAGRDDLALRLFESWQGERPDPGAAEVFPFYVGYRSVVRAKVRGLQARAEEVADADRERWSQRARAHWLLALRWLERPARRPALMLVCGLPGTGKSTLAQGLAERADAEVLRADVVRKAQFGLSPEADAGAAFGDGIYTDEATQRTYAALVGQARDALDRGARVVIDATLRSSERRAPFEALAAARAVPLVTFVLDAPSDIVEARLRARVGDASDADVAVYRRARETWEPPAGDSAAHLDASAHPSAVLAQALEVLASRGLDGDDSRMVVPTPGS